MEKIIGISAVMFLPVILFVCCFGVVCLVFVFWFVGRLIWEFECTKVLGFQMMSQSGLFYKKLSKYCPAHHCSSCKTWTCPSFQKDERSGTGICKGGGHED